jgi:hypothetical protein
MRNVIISIFFFICLNCLGQKNDPCQYYVQANSNLIREKKALQEDKDKLDEQLDLLQAKYDAEYRLRLDYQRRYEEQKKRTQIAEDKLVKFQMEQASLEAERNSLRTQVAELKKANLTKEESYSKSIIRINELNGRIIANSDSVKNFKTVYKEQDEAVKILQETVKRLEDEANDRIFVKEQTIVFNGGKYSFGQEIFFYFYEDSQSDRMKSHQNDYLLRRLSKLISKYDFRAKLLLVGESEFSERGDRIELAKARAKHLQSKFISELGLRLDNFSDLEYKKEQARMGVAVKIVKR